MLMVRVPMLMALMVRVLRVKRGVMLMVQEEKLRAQPLLRRHCYRRLHCAEHR